MLIGVGVALIAIDVIAELVGGTLFRRFFDRSYPAPRFRHDDIPIKVHLSRVGLVVGVVLLAAGLIAAAL